MEITIATIISFIIVIMKVVIAIMTISLIITCDCKNRKYDWILKIFVIVKVVVTTKNFS